MKEVRASVEINAPASRVWKILTDFPRYREWNPFVRWIKGKPKKGERIQVRVQPSGYRGMAFNATISKAEKNKELRWIGHLFIPGLIDGEHVFQIMAINKRKVKFIQSEVFTGLLSPLLKLKMYDKTILGFNEMNLALKNLAER